MPTRGPLAALTVPGAIAAWMLAQDAAKAQGGKLPLDVLLAGAIKHAREGYTVTRSQARLTAEKLPEMKEAVGFRDAFLIDGKAPEVGATLKQSAFAATLDHLSHAGLDDFYRGDVGREIASDLERIGSPVTRTDLEQFRAWVDVPLSVGIQAGTLYNAPPPTQGLASLIILGVFDRLRVQQAEIFEHIHGLVEATKRAFRVRDRVVSDPDRITVDLDRFLTPAFLDEQAGKIDMRKAAKWPAPDGQGDTIWMGAADASGLVVSYIQSLYWEFGSGCVLPKTGVLMQNRGASFSLRSGALNALAPGRRPFHTLNPALAALKDGRVIAYGTMGGDGQPQSQAAVFTRHVLFHKPLDKALDAPRWLLGRTWGTTRTNLRMESRFDGNLIDRLMAAGHDVEVLDEAYSDTMGHAGAVVLHADGTLEGGHDPRADGGAAGV
jgi:gamma-glutamyltranspeptidase